MRTRLLSTPTNQSVNPYHFATCKHYYDRGMPLVMRKPRGGAGREEEDEESWKKRRKSQLYISDEIMRKHFDDVGSEDGLNTREVLMLADKLWATFMSGYPAFSYEIRKEMVKEVISLSEKSEDKLISYEVFAEFFRNRRQANCALHFDLHHHYLHGLPSNSCHFLRCTVLSVSYLSFICGCLRFHLHLHPPLTLLKLRPLLLPSQPAVLD